MRVTLTRPDLFLYATLYDIYSVSDFLKRMCTKMERNCSILSLDDNNKINLKFVCVCVHVCRACACLCVYCVCMRVTVSDLCASAYTRNKAQGNLK